MLSVIIAPVYWCMGHPVFPQQEVALGHWVHSDNINMLFP